MIPSYVAIVDGALALHGAILVVAYVAALLVGSTCDGGNLVLDLLLQHEERFGVQADDACVGCDSATSAAFLWWTALSALIVAAAAAAKEEEEMVEMGLIMMLRVVLMKDLQLHIIKML